MEKGSSWCKRGIQRGNYPKYPPSICYNRPQAACVSEAEYDLKRLDALGGTLVESTIIPKKSALAFTLKKNDLFRLSVPEGSQVADLNFWNLHNTKERFYSGKTRQFHSSHLKVYDRLWSCLPYLNPMATFVFDTLAPYGIDEDGGSVHDVIGTRCDDYSVKLITGKTSPGSCHRYLTEAVKKYGLTEEDVHDVWNVFMCTGFTDTLQYFCKPSPARKGDYIEIIADMDLLVAVCACPHGDVSVVVGEPVPDEKCFPLKVEIFRKNEN